MEEFKVIIAGGRNFNNFPLLRTKMDEFLVNKIKTHQIVIVSGGARGADTLGEKYGKLKGFKIIRIKANWNKHGKAAGFVRNKEMLDIANGVVCCWDKVSKGTGHLVKITKQTSTPINFIYY